MFLHKLEMLISYQSVLIDFYSNIDLKDGEKIALLGLNPHAGDNGVLGR